MKEKNIIDVAVNYFSPHPHSFWKWAEEGEVVEWSANPGTLVFKKDLAEILRDIQATGLPELSSILLILYACTDRYDTDNVIAAFNQTLKEESKSDLISIIDETTVFLQKVNNLGPEVRKGEWRKHLAIELLGQSLNQKYPFENRLIVDVFLSGDITGRIIRPHHKKTTPNISASVWLKGILHVFRRLNERFPDQASLENKIKTGISQTPEPVEIPDMPEETSELDLLSQLEKDEQTIGLAKLTRKLMAGIHIPLQTKGSSERALGGISDIANRGNFDKLLISELANDETTLLARLVNNEALYYKQEEPPSDILFKRKILLDTTIKMWGLPRTFGMAAALAGTQNVKEGTEVEIKVLLKDETKEIDFSSKDGVKSGLQEMSHALDCSEALFETLKQTDEDEEVIWVTSPESRASVSFLGREGLKSKLSYGIEVDRSGELQLFRFKNGRKSLLSKLKYNLDEILFSIEENKTQHHRLPAFVKEPLSPLLFPSAGVQFDRSHAYCESDLGAVVITQDHRVLLWREKGRAGVVKLNKIEHGRYHITSNDNKHILILVEPLDKGRNWIVYCLNRYNEPNLREELKMEHMKVIRTCAWDGDFYIQVSQYGYMKLNLKTWSWYEVSAKKGHKIMGHYYQNFNRSEIKRVVNSGYSVLKRIEDIYINDKHRLCFDSRELVLTNQGWLKINDGKKMINVMASQKPYTFSWIENEEVTFTRFTFHEGSEVVIDSRGFLHCKSSDPSIPEFTLLFIIRAITAIWVADRTKTKNTAGAAHFTRDREQLFCNEMYDLTVNKFIQHILKK